MSKRDFVFVLLSALYSVESNASGATIKNVNYDGVDEARAIVVLRLDWIMASYTDKFTDP